MIGEEQRLFVEIKGRVRELHPGSRFVRWQEIRIKQFGFVNNVVLLLASGVLGFVVRSENTSALEKVGILALLLSILFGLFSAWTRLWDFRLTAQLSRAKATGDCEHSCSCIYCKVRHKVDELGERSWMLLGAQLFTFGAGISLIVFHAICS